VPAAQLLGPRSFRFALYPMPARGSTLAPGPRPSATGIRSPWCARPAPRTRRWSPSRDSVSRATARC
jgi:hypothetical protein